VTRYVALLRAVNVGGRNKVPMATLREIADDLGYTRTATYVQSGNLVLGADGVDAAEVETAVASRLKRALGLTIDVVVRSRAELAAVVAANPFEGIADDPARLMVSFLTGSPRAEAADLDRGEFAPERFELGDRCVYLWYPHGAGRSKMAAAPWERRLGVRGTARNWRTLEALLELLDR
jgi:uncharacterized protein (DUF1697 family)